MDGKSHDHLNQRLAGGGWRGLLVEPLSDYFDALREAYSAVPHLFAFENVAIAEEDGEREMHRVVRGGVSEEDALMGFDGSSSLLLSGSGLPPGVFQV